MSRISMRIVNNAIDAVGGDREPYLARPPRRNLAILCIALFTLAEFVPNDHIKLAKNPKFYDAANVKVDVVKAIVPRLAQLCSDEADQVEALALEDPFITGKVAEVEVIEWTPSFLGAGLEALAS